MGPEPDYNPTILLIRPTRHRGGTIRRAPRFRVHLPHPGTAAGHGTAEGFGADDLHERPQLEVRINIPHAFLEVSISDWRIIA